MDGTIGPTAMTCFVTACLVIAHSRDLKKFTGYVVVAYVVMVCTVMAHVVTAYAGAIGVSDELRPLLLWRI